MGGTRSAAGLAVVCAAHFLIGADGLAIAIALPTLQRDLAVAAIDAQWSLTAYGLAFCGLLLLGAGWAICTAAAACWWPDGGVRRWFAPGGGCSC